MTKVALDRARVYLDGRDISLLLSDLEVTPEVHEEIIEVLWRPQPIKVLHNKKASGSFSAHLWQGTHYTALEEAMAEILSRYDQVNGFTFERRTWNEITENALREVVEARQVDDSGAGINFDDAPGITQEVLIRGDRIDYLTLDVLVDSIAAGEGIVITNDINAATVYIQKADLAVGEKKYTMYTAKSGGTATTLSCIATGNSEPNIGQVITLTLKTTAAGSNVTLDSNSGNSEIYFIAEQSNLKRHWLEIRMFDAATSKLVKIIMKYVTLKLASQTGENRTTESFTINFMAEDYAIVEV